jgi:hypothetical protein
MKSNSPRRRPPLVLLLPLVFAFFCGFLVYLFVAAKRADPVLLDERGRPVKTESAAHGH